jgi:hypothetical protein
VGIYIKEGINFSINTCAIFMERVFETIFVDIFIGKRKISIGSVYRCISKHPTLSPTDQFTIFNDLLHNLLNEISPGELFLGGDLNLDVLKLQSDKLVSQYIDCLFSNGCLQVVTRPTRCSLTSATCIDQCITNISQPCFQTSLLISKLSDHFPVFTLIKQTKSKTKHSNIISRNFSDENVTRFSNQLLLTDWSPTLD